MEADQLGRLRDILAAARLVAAYVKDITEADFRANTEKQDAVVRRLEIIGEATVHLSETTRQAVPELPFRKMRGMRNIVAHDSLGLTMESRWDSPSLPITSMRTVNTLPVASVTRNRL